MIWDQKEQEWQDKYGKLAEYKRDQTQRQHPKNLRWIMGKHAKRGKKVVCYLEEEKNFLTKLDFMGPTKQ